MCICKPGENKRKLNNDARGKLVQDQRGQQLLAGILVVPLQPKALM